MATMMGPALKMVHYFAFLTNFCIQNVVDEDLFRTLTDLTLEPFLLAI